MQCVRWRRCLIDGCVSAMALIAPAVADAQAPELSPTDVYREYVDAFSRGLIDEALAYFADDAVVVAGPACSGGNPCIGKAAIRQRYLEVLIARRLPAPASDQRYDGVRLRTHGEEVRLITADGTVVRLMAGHTFEFGGGRITALRFALDTNDAATAAFLEQAASAASFARLDTRPRLLAGREARPPAEGGSAR